MCECTVLYGRYSGEQRKTSFNKNCFTNKIYLLLLSFQSVLILFILNTNIYNFDIPTGPDQNTNYSNINKN